MRPKYWKIVFLSVVAFALYWPVTNVIIDYSAHRLGEHQYDFGLFPQEHRKFLQIMGQRSLPAIERRLDDANIDPKSKIDLASLAIELGDKSKLAVIWEGLDSDKGWIRRDAVGELKRHPQECLANLPALLAVRETSGSNQYTELLRQLGREVGLSKDRQSEFNRLIQSNPRVPFSPEDIRRIQEYLTPTRVATTTSSSTPQSSLK